MKNKILGLATLLLTLPVAASAGLSDPQAQRIHDAATVLRELRTIPDKGIPEDLWDKAECVLVVPSLKKAAFIVGGEYGKGLMSCRRGSEWSSPVFMLMGKGSWGFQIGAESVDLVLLVMNKGGMEKLLRNQTSLGVDIAIAAGPVGRNAQAATDAQMKAEILSYSRAQGLFAGANISGGVVKTDEDDNQDLYGRDITARRVLLEAIPNPPAATTEFMKALERS